MSIQQWTCVPRVWLLILMTIFMWQILVQTALKCSRKYISQYDSQVNCPAGIAVDDEGNTFITENGIEHSYSTNCYLCQGHWSHLCILNSGHQVRKTLTVPQNATGIAMDMNSSIYVCSSSTCKVLKISM